MANKNVLDILSIKPTSVGRDLQGKFILVYGAPKSGKTSFAARMPDNLLCAFETGYNALSNIKAVDIDKWATFKLVLRQLKSNEAKDMYKTITIDTAGIAYTLCEEYICSQQGVTSISEIPWGAGYALVEKEFQNCLRQITQMGYGLVLISHSATRIEKTSDGSEIEIVAPDLQKRAYKIINQLVDIIGYIDVQWDEDGNSRRYLYTRKTPRLMAGSRFKYLAPKIPFGYDELTKAVGEAIDKEAAENNTVVLEHHENNVKIEHSFNEIREEARALWDELIQKDTQNADKIMKIIQNIFGHPMKLSEITESQKDLFELVVVEMKEL